MNPATLKIIVDLLALMPSVIQGVAGAVETWKRGTDLLQKMVDEDRDPTPEEWAEWQAGIDAAHGEIQNG